MSALPAGFDVDEHLQRSRAKCGLGPELHDGPAVDLIAAILVTNTRRTRRDDEPSAATDNPSRRKPPRTRRRHSTGDDAKRLIDKGEPARRRTPRDPLSTRATPARRAGAARKEAVRADSRTRRRGR